MKKILTALLFSIFLLPLTGNAQDWPSTKGLANPEVIGHLEKIGATAEPSESPAAFASFIRQEHARWGKVIRDGNIKAE